MTIEQIKDEYAKEQGYDEGWEKLILVKMINYDYESIIHHENAVIQLVQDELKKKMASTAKVKCVTVQGQDEYIHDDFIVDKQSILNTENIK